MAEARLCRVDRILATCWLNDEDYRSGNASSLAYAWAPKLTRAVLPKLLGASLPAPVAKGTVLLVRLTTLSGQPASVWVPDVPVIDSGPWRTDDAYWTRGGRPAAESMKGKRVGWDKTRKGWFVEATPRKYTCNGAGVDLTPAVFDALLKKAAGYHYTRSPDAYVDIIVKEPGAVGDVPR